MNIQEQEKKLRKEQQDLEEKLNNIGRKTDAGDWMVVPDEGDDSTADPIDNADITEDYEEKLARFNLLEKEYQQIQKALTAIEKGTYGICEISGKKIPEDRLMANPSATTLQEYAQ